MDNQSNPPSPQVPGPTPGSSSRSTIAGIAVVLVLVGLGALLVMANFQGAVNEDGVGKGPLVAKGKNGPKNAKNKNAKNKQQKGKVNKVPADRLLVDGPDVARPPAPEGAKNVVVVVPTSVRKDHVSAYGADPALTPFLAEVGQKGARFADTISAGPFSRYATWAAFTGRYPASFGAVEPGDAQDLRALPAELDTMTEVFQKSGWTTYGVTANFNLNSNTGFTQGFDRFRDAQPSGFAPEVRLEGPAAVAVALQLLKDRSTDEKGRPFFLTVNLVDAHAPHRAVKELVERFQPDQPNALYRSAVFRTDQYLRDLWKGLGEQGYDEKNTFLVVVGDHGEGLDDPKHHGKAHGKYLYETAVDVPWLVMGPGVPAGRVVDGLSSSVDVMPTVLGLAGLSAPGGLDGQSWAPALTGGEPRTTRQTAISDTWYFEANRAAIFSASMACQKDFGSPPIENDTFVDGCFDRKVDPTFKEVKPLDPLMADLEKWRATVTPKVMEIPPISAPEGGRAGGKAPAGGKAGGKAPGKAGGKAPGGEEG